MIDDQIADLQSQLASERSARIKAERVADERIQALAETNRELEARIRQGNADLELALQRAEAAARSKSQFLATLSHEIRTPLNALVGMLELLHGVPTDDTTRRWLNSAHDSAERLAHLFVRLLHYLDLDYRGKPDFMLPDAHVRSPATDVLDRCVTRWRRECANAGQILLWETTALEDVLVASPAEVVLVLDELLSNVVTHASKGVVELSARPEGNRVRFSVKDPGPGIPQQVLAQPARLLEHVDDSARRADAGSGLGIALIQRASEALGGSWGATVDEQGSSTTWLDVPLHRDDSMNEAAHEPSSEHLSESGPTSVVGA